MVGGRLATLTIFELLQSLLVIASDNIQGSRKIKAVYENLRLKSGQDISDDVDAWATWFLNSDIAWSDGERELVMTAYRIYRIEHEAITKLQS